MSSDVPNLNREEVVVKKSKKKKIAVVSTVVILIPVILSLIYVLNPEMSGTLIQKISIHDFPVEKFSEEYDILCLKDKGCLVKDDGRILLTLTNGIYKFQTADYSLMKGFSDDFGYEEKSISYAYYEQGTTVKQVDGNGFAMWLVTAKGKQ